MSDSEAGLPDFSWYNIPKRGKIKWPQNIPNGQKYTKWLQNKPNCHKIYQIATKYTTRTQNIPNGRKIDQVNIKFTSQVPPNFSQN
jgi:hypothetical protein